MRTQDPAAVIKAVIDAANMGNVDGMVDHFSQDAVLKLDPEIPTMRPVYQGRLEIREYVEQIVSNGFQVDADEFKTTDSGVSWRSTVSGGIFGRARAGRAEVQSHAIVQSNQILSISIHYSPETLRKLQAALPERV